MVNYPKKIPVFDSDLENATFLGFAQSQKEAVCIVDDYDSDLAKKNIKIVITPELDSSLYLRIDNEQITFEPDSGTFQKIYPYSFCVAL